MPYTTIEVMNKLCERGWVSLRMCSVLLGYASPGCMYQRQGGQDPVAFVKVGNIHRVYEDTVMLLLEQMALDGDTDAKVNFKLYREVKKRHESSIRIA